MKTTKLTVLVMAIAVALFLILPSLSWGEDAAATFKAKCAVCHGADGKKLAKADFSSDKVQKASDADLVDMILNGGKEKKATHAFGAKGISEDQAKALASYAKEIGKK